MSRRRRRFRPTVGGLEPRIALSSSSGLSSIFGSIFPGLFGNSNSSTSHKSTTHTLAYYEKLAPTNPRAAQIVQNVEARREKAAELKAAHTAALAAHGHGHA